MSFPRTNWKQNSLRGLGQIVVSLILIIVAITVFNQSVNARIAPAQTLPPPPPPPPPPPTTSTSNTGNAAGGLEFILFLILTSTIIVLAILYALRRRRAGHGGRERRARTQGLETVSRRSPLTPVAAAGGAKFCTACGVRIPATDRFCRSCGAKQD